MIDTLRRYSLSLAFLRPVALILIIITLLFALYATGVFGATTKNDYFMPSVVAFVWSLNVYIMLLGFANVPPKPTKEMSVINRISIRIRRCGYHVLGVVFVAVSAGALYIGFSLLKIWLLR